MKLEEVRFATPCTVPWEQMKGDDRVRFCDKCRKNVYNLSAMPRAEAEAFVTKSEGRECLQLYLRPDGTVATTDCGNPLPPPPVARAVGVPARPSSSGKISPDKR